MVNMTSPISPIPVTPPNWQRPVAPDPANGGIVPPWLQYPIIILPIDDPDDIRLPVITDPVPQ